MLAGEELFPRLASMAGRVGTGGVCGKKVDGGSDCAFWDGADPDAGR